MFSKDAIIKMVIEELNNNFKLRQELKKALEIDELERRVENVESK